MHYNYGKNLFIAIIVQALDDAEYIVKTANREIQKNKVVSSETRLEMRTLEHEIKSEWFQTICLSADVDHDKIKGQLIKIKHDANWYEMPFNGTDVGTLVVRKETA